MSPGVSYDNTDHPPITVINDLLQCILQFLLALIGHLGDLGLDAVFYDLFNGFAEDIGIPDDLFTVFGNGFYVCDQVLCLLLASHNMIDLGLDLGPDQVYRGRLGLHFHAVLISMTYHFRFI